MAIDWVTGKALKTVLDLHEVRPGDEIMCGRCSHKAHRADEREEEFYGEPLTVVKVDDHPVWPIEVRHESTVEDWYWCFCSVIAWRRPKKQEGK